MSGVFYLEEHTSCRHYISDAQVSFKYLEVEPGSNFLEKSNAFNHLVFLLDGEMLVTSDVAVSQHIFAGEMFLVPYFSILPSKVLKKGSVILFTFVKPTNLCTKMDFESLAPLCKDLAYRFKSFVIHPVLSEFLSLLSHYLQDGVMCQHLHELKHKELFILMRLYYTRKDLAELFHPIIGKTLDFKSLVMQNYFTVTKVQELAEICGFSKPTFAKKFKDEFGINPYEWMQKQKSDHIKSRLADISLPIKEIVDEFQFVSQAHMNTYCKKFFGTTAAKLRRDLITINDAIIQNDE
jgi:AraC-like DNA-binding protein